jgi:hypothetical protein
MKQIINKKVYDTQTATRIANYDNGLFEEDIRYLYEALYKTCNNQFFLYGSGGPLSKYNVEISNNTYGTETIILFTEEEAYEWLESHDEIDAIEQYFADMIQEG